MNIEAPDLTLEHIYNVLKILNLDPNDFVVFGSAALALQGIEVPINPHDIDIVARGKAWGKARQMGDVATSNKAGQRILLCINGIEVEIFSAWYPDWSADFLIDTSVEVNGIKCADPELVLTYKRILKRNKDLPHIRSIEEYRSRLMQEIAEI